LWIYGKAEAVSSETSPILATWAAGTLTQSCKVPAASFVHPKTKSPTLTALSPVTLVPAHLTFPENVLPKFLPSVALDLSV